MSLHLDAKYMKFMYPKSKRCNYGTTTYLLPFYTYTNRLFRKIMTPREGDGLKIPSYSKNILAVMAPNGYEFLVFDFIWEEIKAISNSTLKSCGYASYIMHIIERVTGHTFGCDKEHHPLRINNDLKAPSRTAVEQPLLMVPHLLELLEEVEGKVTDLPLLFE
jgi:hypothetical protein